MLPTMNFDENVLPACVVCGGEGEGGSRQPFLDDYSTVKNDEDARERDKVRCISFGLGMMNGILVAFTMMGDHVCYFVRNGQSLQEVVVTTTYAVTSLILAVIGAIIGIPLAFLLMLQSLVRTNVSKQVMSHLSARFLEGTTAGLLFGWAIVGFVLGYQLWCITSFCLFVMVTLHGGSHISFCIDDQRPSKEDPSKRHKAQSRTNARIQ